LRSDLESAGRLCGANRWAETQMFEILGSWVPTTAEVPAKLMLDRHSLHHAWRADQWWERLPVVADVDREALVTAPSAAASSAIDSLREMSGPVSRLAGAYRVAIPRLAAAYQHQLAVTSPVAASSILRTLDIVMADLLADWREGEYLLQSLLSGKEEVTEAAEAVRTLETLLAAQSHPLG
jgi:hypothetical protein